MHAVAPPDADPAAHGIGPVWAALTLLAWLAAAAAGVLQYRHALTVPYVGVDVRPLRGAGEAVLRGQDVYTVHNFVYPPSAAVLSVPLTAVDPSVLVRASVVVAELAIAALALGAVWVAVPAAPYRPALAGALALVLIGSYVSYHALALDNVSVLLAPVVAALAWLLGSRRWWWGCLVLVATLLLKPLLVPLLLVPLLARRLLPLLVPLVAAGILVIACLPLTGGWARIGEVTGSLLRGSLLVGSRAGNNLSFAGFATVHHLPAGTLTALRVAVVVTALAACTAAGVRPRRWDPAQVAWLATALLLAVYLAGNLSEVHYLYALVPGAVGVAARSRSRPARGLGLVALVLLGLPLWGLPTTSEQALAVAAETTLLAAVTLALVVAALRDRRQPPTQDGATRAAPTVGSTPPAARVTEASDRR